MRFVSPRRACARVQASSALHLAEACAEVRQLGPQFMACAPVLVIESAPELGVELVRALGDLGQPIFLARSADQALALLEEFIPGVVVVDFRMPAGQALRLRTALQARQPAPAAVVVSPGVFDRRALPGATVLPDVLDAAALQAAVRALLTSPEPEPPPPPSAPEEPPPRVADPPQGHVLRALHSGPLAPTAVGERLLGAVPRRRVRPVLRELLALGWVERVGRLRWQLTDAGKRELERLPIR
ncbi:MAG: response regulator [Deltaproteobacteria bacterium]|nr:response regulator [Deltaproteobacteria bacterium]